MKIFLKSALLSLTVLASSVSVSNAQELKKVGFLDSGKIMSSFWKMKVLNTELLKEQAAIKAENETKVEQLKQLNEELKKLRKQLGDPNLVRSKLEELKSAFERKSNKLSSSDKMRQELIQGKLKALNMHKENKSQELLRLVRDVVVKYATEKGFDAVTDKASYIYINEEFDVTDDILTLLNKDSELKEEEPAAEAEPAKATAPVETPTK